MAEIVIRVKYDPKLEHYPSGFTKEMAVQHEADRMAEIPLCIAEMIESLPDNATNISVEW